MRLETDPKKFALDLRCPDCSHTVRGVLEAGPVYRINEGADPYAYLICRCPRSSCSTLLFITYERVNRFVYEVFPYPQLAESRYHESVPQPIREDYAEANRCRFTQAYKGVVAMCRRTMQAIARDKKAKGKGLKEEINDLHSKGLITKSLHDAAQEIRFFGNYGAHPQDDGLDNITREEAEAVLGLTKEFLVDLYIRPHETAQLTKKRQAE